MNLREYKRMRRRKRNNINPSWVILIILAVMLIMFVCIDMRVTGSNNETTQEEHQDMLEYDI